MWNVRKSIATVLPAVLLMATGCTVPNVNFSDIQRPMRAAELDAYDVFVGSWDWEAEMVNAEEANRQWNGRAEWAWTLDRRCLEGRMSAKSGDTEFDSLGVWSWHPKQKKYIWWMFNNWGFPQNGTASYDEDLRQWTMKYKSVGLDGTTSHGKYEMNVVDNDTLDWRAEEWADSLHTVKKLDMTGTYKRRR